MREALRRTQNDVSQASINIVSFFFNARGEELEKTTRGLYRSLLHQILKQDLSALNYLFPEYLEKMKGRRSDHILWEEEDLKGSLSQVCQCGISIPVLVFIDALDECTDPEISRLIDFFQGLVDKKKDANASLRVCISSRHCPRPPTFGYPEITVEHHNKDDIYTYIETELKNYKSLLELRDQIFERSSGVFLWVRLVIKQLREEERMYPGRPLGFLEKRLMEIPPELGELFGSLLEKISLADRPRAICMFQLVLVTRVRLLAEDIAVLISFHPETRFRTIEEWTASGERINGVENQKAMITSLSGGLLEFDKNKQSTCQFIHESVRDYFIKYGGFKSLYVPQDNLHVVGWCHSGLVASTVNYSRVYWAKFFKLFLKRAPKTLKNSAYKEKLKREGDNKHLWQETVKCVEEEMQLEMYDVDNIFKHIEIAEREGFSQLASLKALYQTLAHGKSCILGLDDEIYDGLLPTCFKQDVKRLSREDYNFMMKWGGTLTGSDSLILDWEKDKMVHWWNFFCHQYPFPYL